MIHTEAFGVWEKLAVFLQLDDNDIQQLVMEERNRRNIQSAPPLGARLRGRTATQRSKKGSEKVLGRVLGKGSKEGSEKGTPAAGFTVKKGSEKGSQKGS